MSHLVDSVGRDLEALQGAGVDGFLFCNEADLPYQIGVGPEVVAGMSAVIGEVRSTPFASVRCRPRVGPDREPRRRARDRRLVRSRGVHRRLRERPRHHASGLRRDRRIPSSRSAASSVAMFTNITPEFASSLGTPLARGARSQRGLPRCRRDPHQRADHRERQPIFASCSRPRLRSPTCRCSPTPVSARRRSTRFSRSRTACSSGPVSSATA